MLKTINGEIFHASATTAMAVYEAAVNFFKEGHDNDLIAIDDYCDEPIYVSKMDVLNGKIDEDCFIHFSQRMFKDARRNKHIIDGGIVPVLNEFGEPVCLLQKKEKHGYVHYYEKVKGMIDTRVFELYDNIVFLSITEHAFILLKDALADYKGRIFCIGGEWLDFERLLPGRDNITYVVNESEMPTDLVPEKTMYLDEFASFMAGHEDRCNEGYFSYDEIMTLVYFFSIHRSYGDKYPDKSFYLVNPVFPMEGLMSICDKVQYPYAYAEANGFIPVIRLTQSDDSMYSDNNGEDIWSKFFVQPYGEEADNWEQAQFVCEFPFSVITFSDRWLMSRIVDMKVPSLMRTDYINERVKEEIEKQRDVLPNPGRTIGVLLRGTDYTTSHLPGHPIMASPEQVMEKIKEYEATGKYDEIYLATEDEDILQKMKEICGDRLRYIDQKRFRINPGELLSDQKKERENEGWLKGKEYLTTLKFLSECKSFIASGGCCGTTCALNSGKDNFDESYVFDLGCY